LKINLENTLAKARASQLANQYLPTDKLMDKALYMETPWGKAIIMSVGYAYSRRITINNNIHTIKYYKITLSGISIKSILTAESTLWKIVK
jgi:hypothetical protein